MSRNEGGEGYAAGREVDRLGMKKDDMKERSV